MNLTSRIYYYWADIILHLHSYLHSLFRIIPWNPWNYQKPLFAALPKHKKYISGKKFLTPVLVLRPYNRPLPYVLVKKYLNLTIYNLSSYITSTVTEPTPFKSDRRLECVKRVCIAYNDMSLWRVWYGFLVSG